MFSHILYDLYVPPYGMCFDDTTDYCHGKIKNIFYKLK